MVRRSAREAGALGWLPRGPGCVGRAHLLRSSAAWSCAQRSAAPGLACSSSKKRKQPPAGARDHEQRAQVPGDFSAKGGPAASVKLNKLRAEAPIPNSRSPRFPIWPGIGAGIPDSRFAQDGPGGFPETPIPDSGRIGNRGPAGIGNRGPRRGRRAGDLGLWLRVGFGREIVMGFFLMLRQMMELRLGSSLSARDARLLVREALEGELRTEIQVALQHRPGPGNRIRAT